MDYEKKTVKELRDLLKEKGTVSSGTRSVLIERLKQIEAGSSVPARRIPKAFSASSSASNTPDRNSYDAMNKELLKKMLKERKLPVGGIKDELIVRLKNADEGVISPQITPPLIGNPPSVPVVRANTVSILQSLAPGVQNDKPKSKAGKAGKEKKVEQPSPDLGPQPVVLKSLAPKNPPASNVNQLPEDLNKLTLTQLRERLKKKELVTSGNKQVLIDRLLAAENKEDKKDKEKKENKTEKKKNKEKKEQIHRPLLSPGRIQIGGMSIIVSERKTDDVYRENSSYDETNGTDNSLDDTSISSFPDSASYDGSEDDE